MLTANDFTHDCTGDVCAGDTILFEEAVFGGSYRSPKFMGNRTIAAKVLRDSYGRAKQQHTFVMEVIWCEGYDPLRAGTHFRRRGRNVYRQGTKRLPWDDEGQRQGVLAEKHQRGDHARAARHFRKEAA